MTKQEILNLIDSRIEKARVEHYEDKWLDRNEYITVKAELMAIKYHVENMEGSA